MLSAGFLVIFLGCSPLAEAFIFFSPPRCGGKRACILRESTCEGGRCVCQDPYTWGKGDFQCYEETELGCEIKNDPSLTTYARESEQFPFPCRYLVSHVRQEMIKQSTDEVIGTCEAQVFASNTKAQGKFFVSSFDVALKLTYDNPYRVVESSFRQFAYTRDTVTNSSRFGTNGQSSPFVPDGTDDIRYFDNDNDVKVLRSWDHENERYLYRVLGCGIRIALVPYDIELKLNQIQVPGLAVAISERNNPIFLSPNEAMCLAPPDYGGQTIREIQSSSLTRERSLLLRAFKSGVIQNQYIGEKSHCSQLSSTLNTCEVISQKLAMKKCDWILKQPHFMKCYDKTQSGEHIIHLFKMCVEAWCLQRPCAAAIAAITVSGCSAVDGVTELEAFMAGNMCPEEILSQTIF